MAPLAMIDGALRHLGLLRTGPTSAAGTLMRLLERGEPLGRSLRAAGPALASAAVTDALRRFESGAVALFIVEVRDSLRRQLYEAGVELHATDEQPLARVLTLVAARLDDDTFIQHLVNATLEATDLYSEALPFEPRRRSLKRLEAAVGDVLLRSLCVLLTRSEAAHTVNHGLLPQLSWPPSTVARG